MLTASADEGVCRKVVVYEAVQSLTMPEGVGGWTKRDIEMFRLFCERLRRIGAKPRLRERPCSIPAYSSSRIFGRGASIVLPSPSGSFQFSPCLQASVHLA